MKLKEKIVGFISILVISIIFLCFGYMSNKDKEIEFDHVFVQDTNKESSIDNFVSQSYNQHDVSGGEVIEDEIIVVDIKGSVKYPREYELKAGARIRDLIDAAGGLTEEADENRIKFSQVLNDEDCIRIYKVGEESEDDSESFTGTSSTNEESGSNVKINLNKASVSELQTLPGIGTVKAQSIIDYRESVGMIKSIDELTNITGIGLKTIDKFRNMVDIK